MVCTENVMPSLGPVHAVAIMLCYDPPDSTVVKHLSWWFLIELIAQILLVSLKSSYKSYWGLQCQFAINLYTGISYIKRVIGLLSYSSHACPPHSSH